jgi:hypothetical protein
MAGHPIAHGGAKCAACVELDAAFEASLARPPEELVLRSGDGKSVQHFRIPKHLRPRRKVRR